MKTQSTRISFIVSNYNGAPIIKECLPSVIRELEPGDELIFADDCSTDESIKIAQEIHSKARVIQTPCNMGFSGNNNFAAREATNPLLYFINSDITLPEGSVDPLRTFLCSSGEFAAGPIIRRAQPPHEVEFAYTRVRWSHGMLKEYFPGKHTGLLPKNICSSYMLCGGALMCRKDIFEELGGFDDELFSPFYFEDYDLSLRARRAGYSLYCVPESTVYHHSGWSVYKAFSWYGAKKITYRNRYLLHWKHLPGGLLVKKHLSYRLQVLIKALFKFNRLEWLPFFSACIKIPAVIRKRKSLKKRIPFNKILKEFYLEKKSGVCQQKGHKIAQDADQDNNTTQGPDKLGRGTGQ